ncbi:hypothetical protein GGR61_003865 [Xanthomonas arboricola]|nr:hypothetical protein [Xanthomonas sp. 3058]
MPALHAHLPQGSEVKIIGTVHAIQHTCRLPAGIGAARVQIGFLLFDAPLLLAFGLFLQTADGACGAVPIRP